VLDCNPLSTSRSFGADASPYPHHNPALHPKVPAGPRPARALRHLHLTHPPRASHRSCGGTASTPHKELTRSSCLVSLSDSIVQTQSCLSLHAPSTCSEHGARRNLPLGSCPVTCRRCPARRLPSPSTRAAPCSPCPAGTGACRLPSSSGPPCESRRLSCHPT